MSATRRFAWGFLLLGLGSFSMAVARGFWRPDWINDISTVGGSGMFFVGAYAWHRTSPLPRMRDWRNAGKIKTLETRVEANRADLDSLKAQVGDLAGGITRMHGATGQAVPPEVAANAPTPPMLRAIGGGRGA